MNAAKELFEEFNNLMRQAEYSGCTKEFVVMVANKIKKEIIPLSQGDSVWYANFETGEIEKGSVVSVRYKNGELDCFSVDFIESEDFDEFDGKAFFALWEAAELALSMG